MKKKEYERPSIEVVELKQQAQLLAGSTSATIQNYQDGGNVWTQPEP